MKTRIIGWLIALLLVVPLAVFAQEENPAAAGPNQVLDNADVEREVEEGGKRIYRTVDEHGNPVFTDNPPESGPVEEVDVRPSNSVPMNIPKLPRTREVQAQQGDYQLSIVAPEDESTFQNPSQPIVVRVSLSPELKRNHRLEVTADGRRLPGSLEEGFTFEQPTRGEHRLRARVLDGNQVLEDSGEVIIYVHRASVLNEGGDPGNEGTRRRDGYNREGYTGRGEYSRPGPSDAGTQ